MSRLPRSLPICLLFLALAACQRDAQAPGADGASQDAGRAGTEVAPVALEDVMETGDGYIVGISYPRSVVQHPGLAAELKAYAEAARDDLQQALGTPEADGGDPTVPGPYDLSLAFVELHASPDVVAVAADGSSYLGGAHGQPLVRRFVWLPKHGRMLTAALLIPEASGWRAISGHVREQLFAALSLRMDANGIAPEARADMMRSAGSMIEAGTGPDPDNFGEFEPIPGEDGKLAGLRFVFPPYQVGPYSAGTQTVDVPATVLLPHVAPEYRALFEGG
ncbi:MAG TPA: RsiV family protein [Xanthomonadaceae bacterium]|nr:RsiV family protein [Xanthomonadaceae bacterium]